MYICSCVYTLTRIKLLLFYQRLQNCSLLYCCNEIDVVLVNVNEIEHMVHTDAFGLAVHAERMHTYILA